MLGQHHHGEVDVGAWVFWDHRCIDYPQGLNPNDPAGGIYYRFPVVDRTHTTRAHCMREVSYIFKDPLVQTCIIFLAQLTERLGVRTGPKLALTQQRYRSRHRIFPISLR